MKVGDQLKKLKKGDLCYLKFEAIQFAPDLKGRILECVSNQIKVTSNGECNFVLLKGVSGAIHVDLLEKSKYSLND